MHSIGKDFATIRSHLGYTLEDIHGLTKIPLNTLQSIENGSIFEQSDEIKTYIRSFVRSYGRALKLDDQKVVESLDQQEIGIYNHLLLKDFPELYESKEVQANLPPPETKTEEPTESEKSEIATSEEDPDEEVINEFKPAPAPGIRNVDWADMGKQFSSAPKGTSVWIIGAFILVILVLGVAYFLFENDYFTSDNSLSQGQVPEQPVPEDPTGSELQLDVTDEQAQINNTLDETLYLTIYAANDVLEPVRVWSDLKPSIDPYWLNQGIAFNFEFADTIRIRGQYSRMLLFLNGHLIPNFRQNHFNAEENAVELTRDLFEDDPEWATPVSFELPEGVAPPDTVANRPSF